MNVLVQCKTNGHVQDERQKTPTVRLERGPGGAGEKETRVGGGHACKGGHLGSGCSKDATHSGHVV